MNGVEIDRNRNVGITSMLKNYVTVSSDRNVILRNADWDPQAGYFNFCVPLYVLEFCEDYKRMVINSSRVDFNTSTQRQQLSNGRSGDRTNARIIQSTVANAAHYWAR